jgi:choline dehydrogenase-like flavoprotein
VTGVEFSHTGQSLKVGIQKEVILSAGAIKSPQILELSGIGNPVILSKAGAHCVVDNVSVGENLRGHPVTDTGFELVDREISLEHAAGSCSMRLHILD